MTRWNKQDQILKLTLMNEYSIWSWQGKMKNLLNENKALRKTMPPARHAQAVLNALARQDPGTTFSYLLAPWEEEEYENVEAGDANTTPGDLRLVVYMDFGTEEVGAAPVQIAMVRMKNVEPDTPLQSLKFKDENMRLIGALAQRMSALEYANKKNKDIVDSLQQQITEAQAALLRSANIKQQVEEDLFDKFLHLLNAKKRHIRELRNEIDQLKLKLDTRKNDEEGNSEAELSPDDNYSEQEDENKHDDEGEERKYNDKGEAVEAGIYVDRLFQREMGAAPAPSVRGGQQEQPSVDSNGRESLQFDSMSLTFSVDDHHHKSSSSSSSSKGSGTEIQSRRRPEDTGNSGYISTQFSRNPSSAHAASPPSSSRRQVRNNLSQAASPPPRRSRSSSPSRDQVYSQTPSQDGGGYESKGPPGQNSREGSSDWPANRWTQSPQLASSLPRSKMAIRKRVREKEVPGIIPPKPAPEIYDDREDDLVDNRGGSFHAQEEIAEPKRRSSRTSSRRGSAGGSEIDALLDELN